MEDRVKTFFDISINKEPLGRIIFELYNNKLPLTCENFRALCTGERGLTKSGKPLHYKNSVFHRVITNFMAQGGNLVGNDVRGESIYGGRYNDEGFFFNHDKKFLLSCANCGPDTNASGFFITFVECPWLDNKHVVFGEVVQGEDIVKQIQQYASPKGTPQAEIQIVNCGQL